jgi:AbiV family abortive infection protein
MLTPTAARAFWLALLENAARIIIDADALFPSPRAQSLVVLAQEEIGKAVWVYKSFRNAWNDGDEKLRDVPELKMSTCMSQFL